MKLLLPVVKPEDILYFSGLYDQIELYAGIELAAWYERFGRYEDLNRMSAFHRTANMDGIEAIRALCEAAYGKELYLTLNAGSYSIEQATFLENVIAEIADLPVTGIILGDPHLAEMVHRHGLKPVASTMAGIYNSDIARFYYDLGFERLILPRDMTLQEIAGIMQVVPEAEYECFLMRNGCRYSDSHCLARHSDRYGAICTYLDRSRVTFQGDAEASFASHDALVYNHHAFTQAFHKQACGLCAVWDMLSLGITAGKVVGRADGAESVAEDVRILRRNIELAQQCASREEYLAQMEMPPSYDVICYQGCNCYYPEIRYGME